MDFAILDLIREHLRSDAGDRLMPLITALGNGSAVWFALGLGLFAFRKTRSFGLAVLLALGLETLLCNGILKPLVGRARPCDINAAIQLLIRRPEDSSFPSGHTAAAFAAASALEFSRCRGWGFAAALAAVIAFSRLYLYVHFPTDVLAGALLGVLCGYLAVYGQKRFLAGKGLRNQGDE